MAEGGVEGRHARGSAGSRRRRINWTAGVGALAALLSGIAAMTTAAVGVWRPPVPLPVPRVTITWTSSATPTPGATPTPVSAQTPAQASPPASGGSAYSADWTSGMDGWVGAAEWKSVPGYLVSDGSADYGPGWESQGIGVVRAPFRPATGNYAVDARIQIVDPRKNGCFVAMVIRDQVDGQGPQTHGYLAGYVQSSGAMVGSFRTGANFSLIDQATFSPGGDWHDYHAELRANQLTLQIDGSTVLQATDNNYLSPGQVGLSNSRCQVQVSRFSVTPL